MVVKRLNFSTLTVPKALRLKNLFSELNFSFKGAAWLKALPFSNS
jgi:hypothetical protein